jgi:hypothetical protein
MMFPPKPRSKEEYIYLISFILSLTDFIISVIVQNYALITFVLIACWGSLILMADEETKRYYVYAYKDR